MNFSKINTMITPPTPTDWTGLGVIWGIVSGIVAIAYKWINSHFANLKSEKENFIRQVVQSAMDGVMDGKLKDVNDKISTLFDYREKDRANLDRKFETLISEIKKQ